MKREEQLAPASKDQIKDLYEDLMSEIDQLHSFANSAHNEIRYLEDRLKRMFGAPIPHLPPANGEEEDDESWN